VPQEATSSDVLSPLQMLPLSEKFPNICRTLKHLNSSKSGRQEIPLASLSSPFRVTHMTSTTNAFTEGSKSFQLQADLFSALQNPQSENITTWLKQGRIHSL